MVLFASAYGSERRKESRLMPNSASHQHHISTHRPVNVNQVIISVIQGFSPFNSFCSVSWGCSQSHFGP